MVALRRMLFTRIYVTEKFKTSRRGGGRNDAPRVMLSE